MSGAAGGPRPTARISSRAPSAGCWRTPSSCPSTRRAGHPFRIAGTRVCAAFGRELKNERFLNLWAAASRRQVRDLLNVVANETVGVVASARGTSTAETAA